MDISKCLSWMIIFLTASAGIHSLKLISLDVPASVQKGEGVWLNCTLDYENGRLYSIKWYKNDTEFYRYLPGDKTNNQIYDLPGIYIDLNISDNGQVYLNYTDHNTDGEYRCEASGEGPLFQTVEAVKELRIYELPENEPTIHGTLSNYTLGSEINFTCIAGPSKPAAKLTWFINDEPAPSENEIPYPAVKYPQGLESSSLGISFTLSLEQVNTNPTILKCVSSISDAYSITSEELIIGQKQTTTEPSVIDQDADKPVITGGQPSYRTGDFLNLNCTSPKASPPPNLQWFINNYKAPSENVTLYPNIEHDDNEESTVLGLRFKVQQSHFDSSDEMKLKCTSTLSRVIDTRSIDERIMDIPEELPEVRLPEKARSVIDLAAPTTRLATGLVLLTFLLPFL